MRGTAYFLFCMHLTPLVQAPEHHISKQAFLDGRGEDHDDCHSFSELVQAPIL